RPGPPGLALVRRLAVGAHDAGAGRDAGVRHRLHDRALVAAVREPDAVALPVAPGPGRLLRPDQAGDASQELVVAVGLGAAAVDDRGQPLELLAPDGRLQVCQPVVEAQLGVRLEDDAAGL